MHKSLADDLGDIDNILAHAHKAATEYLRTLDARPVSAPLPSGGLPDVAQLPANGVGAISALDRFHREYGTYLSASPGARYFGFVTGGATPAALAADWLVSTYDQNAQLNGDTCAPHIEAQAIDMLKQLLDWPREWVGTCVTGATMANFVGLALARQWWGHAQGRDVAAEGLAGLPPPTIFAGSAHSSTNKALSMLGLGRSALHALPLLPGREAIDIAALEVALKAQAGAPVVIVASAGTVNTVDFDDLSALAELKKRYRFWLHVDAAFGGIIAASPTRRGWLEGIAAADSVTVDAHKWLNVPYDCAIAFTRHLALQIEVFGNHSPYLSQPAVLPNNYLHMAPENSRRFRALPLWTTLLAYGASGYAELVERNCQCAAHLGRLIETEPRLRLVAPVRFNVACFSLADGDDAALARLQAALHASGTAHLSLSRLDGKAILRAAICNWRTTTEDIDRLFGTIRSLLRGI